MTAKKRIIKEPKSYVAAKLSQASRVSNAYKANKVRQIMTTLLREEPHLTKVDVRRIFNYGYRLLWKGGDKLFQEAKGKANLVKGMWPNSATIKTVRK